MTLKRSFDFAIALIFSLLLLPLWLLIGGLIKMDSKGPVFFRQLRIGRDGAPFSIFKFRTMVVDAEEKGLQMTLGEQDPRITRVGLFLRNTKLDELPQIFNVLKGEMSLVGPRPLVPRYLDLHNKEQKKVLRVRPGLTDLASLEYIDEDRLLAHSPNPEATYVQEIMPQKLKLNMEYISRQSFLYDLGIIFKTLHRILTR